jgi:hypothetical protein
LRYAAAVHSGAGATARAKAFTSITSPDDKNPASLSVVPEFITPYQSGTEGAVSAVLLRACGQHGKNILQYPISMKG